MIVVNLKGGLGNQMFQYALGLALAQKSGTELKLDLRYLQDRTPRKNFVYRNYDLDIFSIFPAQASAEDLDRFGLGIKDTKLRELWLRFRCHIPSKTRVLQEERASFNERVLSARGDVYVNGYWQSEKYFKDIAAFVHKQFVVTTPLLARAAELMHQVDSEESVCLNVRRADFVNHTVHGALETEYYKRAVEEMTRRIGSGFRLFVFSDNVEWCQENLRLGNNQEVIGHQYAGPKFASYFSLMSSCKHFIIPNSTFAWWAAWLAKNQNKVIIGPKRWMVDPRVDTRDVLPESWVAL